MNVELSKGLFGFSQRLGIADEYFKDAIAQGNTHVRKEYVKALFDLERTQQHPGLVEHLLKTETMRLDSETQYECGNACEKDNIDRAICFFIQSAEMGNKDAQFRCWELCKDKSRPAEWQLYFLLQAADQAHAGAQSAVRTLPEKVVDMIPRNLMHVAADYGNVHAIRRATVTSSQLVDPQYRHPFIKHYFERAVCAEDEEMARQYIEFLRVTDNQGAQIADSRLLVGLATKSVDVIKQSADLGNHYAASLYALILANDSQPESLAKAAELIKEVRENHPDDLVVQQVFLLIDKTCSLTKDVFSLRRPNPQSRLPTSLSGWD
jgi:hypothetical protein